VKNIINISNSILILLTVIIIYFLVWPVPVEPNSWESPRDSRADSLYSLNQKLKDIKIFWTNDGYSGPEDIVLKNGKIYVGYDNGIIMSSDGIFSNTEGRPLGMAFDLEDNLIVADAIQGLLLIDMSGTVSTLSIKSDSDNIPFKFVDDLDIASDGKIYFSDASSKYGYGSDRLELFEHSPNGRLLVYDPATKTTTTLLKDLYFANGVALSSDESFVLVNETFMYRIQKYWLKGDKAGTSEIFIENLPGFPDNVSSNEEGIFWVALFNPRNNFVEMSSNKPFLRKMVLRLPESLQPQPLNHSYVLGIDEGGKVVHNLQYKAEEAYSPITSVKQYESDLYFGSLTHTGWGKIEAPK
jgi:sugar lactone lactonase YvrE